MQYAIGLAYLGEEMANSLAMYVIIEAFPTHLRGRGSSVVALANTAAGFLAGSVGSLKVIQANMPLLINAGAMAVAGSILFVFASRLTANKKMD